MTTSSKCDWTQLQNYRTFLVVNTIAHLGIIVHLTWIALFFWLHQFGLAGLNVLSSGMWIAAWLLNQRGLYGSAVFLMTSEVILHTFFVVPVAGWHTGFQYYLFAAIPFTLFNNKLEGKTVILISVGLCILYIMLNAYTHDQPENPAISESVSSVINNVNIIISFTALCIISYNFRVASLQLEEELEKQAHTDPLTGLYNRRRMSDFLAQQDALSVRDQSDLSVIFVDIDHFKKINDTHGHKTGDSILSGVADFIRRNLRKTDTLARWGGEEFLILLPNTNLEEARLIAEKIRKAVADHRFRVDDLELTLTLTFGICEHQQNRPIEDSVKYADMALYRGKQAGRNIVISYS